MKFFRVFVTALVLFAIGGRVPAQNRPTTQTLQNAGSYSATVTYAESNVVVSGGVYYISLVANNLNNTPASSPGEWATLGSAGGGGTLGGDVTGPSDSNTVGKVNGATIPVSASVVGTNGSGQFILGSSSTTINGTPCPLGGSCSIGSNLVHAVQPDAEWAFSVRTTSLTSEPDISGSNACSGGPCNLTMAGPAQFGRLPLGGIEMNTRALCGGASCSSMGYMNSPFKSWGTAIFRACMEFPGPGWGALTYSNFGSIWGPASGSGGITWFATAQNPDAPGNPYVFGVWASTLYVDATNAYNTISPTFSGGCHTYVTTLDSVDRFYQDGIETAYSSVHGTSAGSTTTTGTYAVGTGVGGGGSATFGFFGEVLYGEVYRAGTVLTPAQVQQETTYVNNRAGLDPIQATTTQSFVSQAVMIGDSITAQPGVGGVTSYTSLLTLDKTFNVSQVWGSGGDTICNQTNTAKYRGFTSVALQAPYNIISLFSGTNDLQLSVPPEVVWGCMRSAILAALNVSPKVVVSTIMDRQNGAFGSSFANKNAVNALIRQQVSQFGPQVILMDAAENPALGADGASAAGLNNCSGGPAFQDTIHPTQCGQNLLAVGFSAAINSIEGSTESSPDSITGTATLLSRNNYVTTDFTANGTLTLRPCAWLTGSAVTIINPQSTYTVGVIPGGSDTINGSTSSISVPSGKSVKFRDLLNAPSTGGCHWITE